MSRILLVEDEERLAAFIEKGLRRQGYEILTAGDGKQALQMIQNEHFDLLLLDLSLPIKDGWMVLAELRELNQSLPTIIITARDDIGQQIKPFIGEVEDYLVKPFRFQDLLAIVRRIIING